MDFKEIHNLPNVDLILEKMKTSKEKLDIAFIGEVIFEAVDSIVVEGRDKFHVCDGDACNLAMSLIISIFMTCLAYPLGDDKEKLEQLAKECGIPAQSFIKRSELRKKRKEFDA